MPKTKVDLDAAKVNWSFEDKTEIAFDLSKCTPEIQKQLALHGAKQKISDGYAGAKAESDPVAFSKGTVEDIIAQLYEGDWRVGGGEGGPRISDLALAYSRAITAKGGTKTPEQCQAYLDSKDDDAKKALRGRADVTAELLKIRAERTAEAARKAAEKLAKAPAEPAKDETPLEVDFEAPAESTLEADVEAATG